MRPNIGVLVLCGALTLTASGCFALFVGVGAGAGTSVWLSGKLTQEFHRDYDRTIQAARKALKSLRLEIAKEIREDEVTQLRSKYSDGKEIWIDIRRITEASTKVEVRVGAVSPDKAAASRILTAIQKAL